MSAFGVDPAVKAALIAALDKGEPLPMVEPGGASETKLTTWAGEVGLPPAVVLLAARLSPSTGVEVDPEAVTFVRALLLAIEPRADLSGVAHGWLAWSWHDASEPLSRLMLSTEGQLAGAAIAALHACVARGNIVGRLDWRAARTRLSRLAAANDEAGRAAAVLQAGAWDLVRAPGAVDDALSAWESLYRIRIQTADGWGEAEDAKLGALLGEVRPVVRERVGDNPGRGDPQALTVYVDLWRREFTTLMEQHNDPIWDRFKAQQQAVGEALSRLRQEGRETLVRLIGETPQPDRQSADGVDGAASHG